MHTSSPHRGFSMIELLITTALLLFVAAFTLGAVNFQRETANRVRCASHLKQIGMAMLQYASENDGAFPRGLYDPTAADRPTAFTHPDAKRGPDDHCDAMYCPSGPGPNDVTTVPYRLIQTEKVDPKLFLCPGFTLPSAQIPTTASTTAPAELKIPWPTRCNFTGLAELNYSFANPYPSDDAIKAGFKWRSPLSAEYALAGDLNPGVDELTKTGPLGSRDEIHKINSPNHLGDGENVLFGDVHVVFVPNPFWGVNRDNIYTFGVGNGAGIIGSPVGLDDSILLPTANAK